MAYKDGKTYLRDSISKLKKKNFSVTPIRLHILEIIAGFHKPFSADILLSYAHLTDTSIHRATVYHHLEVFIEANVLKQFKIYGRASQFYERASEVRHHHFICRECSDIVDVYPEKVKLSIADDEQKLQKAGLQIDFHRLQLYGACKVCLEKSAHRVEEEGGIFAM